MCFDRHMRLLYNMVRIFESDYFHWRPLSSKGGQSKLPLSYELQNYKIGTQRLLILKQNSNYSLR